MARPATPPVFLNYLAAGIVAGIGAVTPFALSHFFGRGPGETGILPALLPLWAWLAWTGWAVFRVRPLPAHPRAFEFWYGCVIFELAVFAMVMMGWARGEVDGRLITLTTGAGLLALGGGWIPSLFLLGIAEDATGLFVAQVVGPLAVPVAFGTLALLARNAGL